MIVSLQWTLSSILEGDGSKGLKVVSASSKNKLMIKSSYDKKPMVSTATVGHKAVVGLQHLSPLPPILDFPFFQPKLQLF